MVPALRDEQAANARSADARPVTRIGLGRGLVLACHPTEPEENQQTRAAREAHVGIVALSNRSSHGRSGSNPGRDVDVMAGAE